jgi:hypothetical protein
MCILWQRPALPVDLQWRRTVEASHHLA